MGRGAAQSEPAAQGRAKQEQSRELLDAIGGDIIEGLPAALGPHDLVPLLVTHDGDCGAITELPHLADGELKDASLAIEVPYAIVRAKARAATLLSHAFVRSDGQGEPVEVVHAFGLSDDGYVFSATATVDRSRDPSPLGEWKLTRGKASEIDFGGAVASSIQIGLDYLRANGVQASGDNFLADIAAAQADGQQLLH